MRNFTKDFLIICSMGGSIVLALLSLGALAANWNPGYSFYAQLHLHILICGLFAVTVFLFFKKIKWTIIALGISIINFMPIVWAISQIAPVEQLQETKAIKPIKLMWANIWMRNNQLEKIRAEIKRTDPDILIFSEVRKLHAPLLKNLKTDYPYQGPFESNQRPNHIFIASKTKYFIQNNKQWEKDQPPHVHLIIDVNKKPFHLIATHMFWPFNGPQKMRSTKWLGDYINQIKQPVLLVGDFNYTPFSPAMRYLENKTSLRRFGALKHSWPNKSLLAIPFAQFLIDHVLARGTSEIKIHKQSFKIGNDIGSDHYPVIAEFWLEGAATAPIANRSSAP